jgi:hypothetical protein
MTPRSPSTRRTSTSGRPKRTVDGGVATIVAAVILAVGGVAGVFIGRATASGTPSTSTTSKATPDPASATITLPTTGDIPYMSALSGNVDNLQRGQLVWTFFQIVNANGSLNPQTYPTDGPCAVDFKDQTWVCHNACVGMPKDKQTYRVCVAIINFSDAYAVVKLVENSELGNPKIPYWFSSPPSYINNNFGSCMSVHRID